MSVYVVHGLDFVTRRPYTYTIPNVQEDKMTTDLAIRFTHEDDKVVATLISTDATGLAISVEKPDAQTAAAELVKAYFTLNPLPAQGVVKLPSLSSWVKVAFAEGDIKRLLINAMENNEEVIIHYRDGVGAESTRKVEPTHIDDERNLAFAYDVDKGGTRSFRIDRIQRAETV